MILQNQHVVIKQFHLLYKQKNVKINLITYIVLILHHYQMEFYIILSVLRIHRIVQTYKINILFFNNIVSLLLNNKFGILIFQILHTNGIANM